MRRHLVTGSSSGIGAATCRLLAGPGTAFVVHARSNRAGADRVADELRGRGAEAVVAMGDLAEPGTAEALVATAVDRFGGLDVLVANAGYADRTRLDDLSPERFEESLRVIGTGFLRLARAARAPLAAGSFRADAPVFLASAAAKGGLEGMVRALAIELAPQRITVNCVVPGAIAKDSGTVSAMTPEQWRASLARIPLGRVGKPEEVAAAISFLCSPAAAYVTGQALHVNGGLVI